MAAEAAVEGPMVVAAITNPKIVRMPDEFEEEGRLYATNDFAVG